MSAPAESARNRARETRRLVARRNYLANEIARRAFVDTPNERARLTWEAGAINEWADLTRRLRLRRERKGEPAR